MSPKRITNLAFMVGGGSGLGLIIMAVLRPDWGLLTWWPAAGLGLAILLLVVSFLKGAYMAAQKRVHMVDLLNDCNTGVPENQGASRRLGASS